MPKFDENLLQKEHMQSNMELVNAQLADLVKHVSSPEGRAMLEKLQELTKIDENMENSQEEKEAKAEEAEKKKERLYQHNWGPQAFSVSLMLDGGFIVDDESDGIAFRCGRMIVDFLVLTGD